MTHGLCICSHFTTTLFYSTIGGVATKVLLKVKGKGYHMNDIGNTIWSIGNNTPSDGVCLRVVSGHRHGSQVSTCKVGQRYSQSTIVVPGAFYSSPEVSMVTSYIPGAACLSLPVTACSSCLSLHGSRHPSQYGLPGSSHSLEGRTRRDPRRNRRVMPTGFASWLASGSGPRAVVTGAARGLYQLPCCGTRKKSPGRKRGGMRSLGGVFIPLGTASENLTKISPN